MSGLINSAGSRSGVIGAKEYAVATVNANQTISNDTWTAINFDATPTGLDPNDWFDNSTDKFLPTKAGKYFISLMTEMYAVDGVDKAIIHRSIIKLNSVSLDGTGAIAASRLDLRSENFYAAIQCANAIVDMNGSTDYIHSVGFGSAATGDTIIGATPYTKFSAFRIGS